jgi:glucosamine 6-phosphate synthetase-like amidotransferase/phosphosugar isomerase protein
MSLPELCHDQIAGVRQGIADAFTYEELGQYRRIIITGCGDSYVAAMASIPAFRKFAGKFGSNFSYERAIDVSRFMTFDERYSSSTMVVAVSCSGAPARIQEVLARANHYGCMTLAVTNEPESPAAKEAKKALLVHTPAFDIPGPGLRNYYASLTALYMLAASLGEATGCSKPGTVDAMAEAITNYTAAWAERLEAVDDQMFSLAEQWKNCKSFDFIGDDIEFATAFFDAAKIVETCGIMTNTDDSENWCHVGFFQREPERVGTVIVADRYAKDHSRIKETIAQAAGVFRPILLVANGTAEDYDLPDSAAFCNVPDAPDGYDFLMPLLNYVPGAILAGYISRFTEEPFFRGGGVWAQPGNNTIRTSKVEVI